MELNIGPVKQIMDQMGISEDEMNDVAEQMKSDDGKNPDGIERVSNPAVLCRYQFFTRKCFPEKKR